MSIILSSVSLSLAIICIIVAIVALIKANDNQDDLDNLQSTASTQREAADKVEYVVNGQQDVIVTQEESIVEISQQISENSDKINMVSQQCGTGNIAYAALLNSKESSTDTLGCYQLVYGNNVVWQSDMLTGSGSVVAQAYSVDDGVNWLYSSLVSFAMIAFGNAVFSAVLLDGKASSTSSDGITWVEIDQDIGAVSSPSFFSNIFNVFYIDGGRLSSVDGITFNETGLSFIPFNNITESSDTLNVVGSDSFIYQTQDNILWTKTSMNMVTCQVFHPIMNMFFGFADDNSVFTSENGNEWSLSEYKIPMGWIISTAVFSNKLSSIVCCGITESDVVYTYDCSIWRASHLSSIDFVSSHTALVCTPTSIITSSPNTESSNAQISFSQLKEE